MQIFRFLLVLLLMLPMVGCHDEQDERICVGIVLSTFAIEVENCDGDDLLDENIPGNILNEETEYYIEGKRLIPAWQVPYTIYHYENYAYLKSYGTNPVRHCINTGFSWAGALLKPVEIKFVIGEFEFLFTLFSEDGDTILLMPDGQRENIFNEGFTIIIKYDRDGVPTAGLKWR